MNVQLIYPVLICVALVVSRAMAQEGSVSLEVERAPEIIIRTIGIDEGSAQDVAKTLDELLLTMELRVTAQTESNVLIIRGQQDKVEAVVRVIEELQLETKQRALSRQSRTFSIRVPLNSKLTWSGGEGGLTSFVGGLHLAVKRQSSTFLRLGQITGFPGMVVAIEARTAAWDEKTANALNVVPEVQVTEEDLILLRDGLSVVKTITGPHELSVEHPELFETIITKADDGEYGESTQIKPPQDYVAVFSMKGITLPIGGSAASTATTSSQVFRTRSNPFDNGADSDDPFGQSIDPFSPMSMPQTPAEVAAAERQIQLSFEQLRLAHKNKLPEETISKLEDTLRQMISLAFETRQRVQLAEVQAQRNKLDALQDRVQGRTAQAGGIIDRRFKQLQQQAKE